MYLNLDKLRIISIVILCLLWISCAGPDITLQKDTVYDQSIEELQREYFLSSGDVIRVEFYYHPEMERELAVLPSGKITLPLKGDIVAEGLSPIELKEKITTLFSDVFKEPMVTVTVVEYMKNNLVYVMGEVKKSDYYLMEGPTTLTQILARSGGVLATAKLDTVLVISRNEEGKPLGRLVNVEKILAEANIGHDILLKQYDVVYVPKTAIAKVNLFIDQYINRLIPNFFRVTYNLGKLGVD